MTNLSRISKPLRPFLALSILVILLSKPVESVGAYLRKRVAKDNEGNEFGRELKLFHDDYGFDVMPPKKNTNKARRRAATHHIVDATHQKEMFDVEKDMEMAGFIDRMLQQSMSLSMSMQTGSPTATPIQPRSLPPTLVPTSTPTLEPTPALTEYIMPTSLPTKAPTSPPPVEIQETAYPTKAPTSPPSVEIQETAYPTKAPTSPPVEIQETANPTKAPYSAPTPVSTESPTYLPTSAPTVVQYTLSPTSPPTLPNGYPTVPPDVSDAQTDTNVRVLSAQQTPGVCNGPSNGVGCASESQEMQGGNPNDIVNCYSAAATGLSPPFQLTAVRFWMGDSTVPPVELSIVVWAGTVEFGPTTTNLYSQPLHGYAPGENTAQLTETLLIFDAEFCVGVKSTSMTDGLRIQTDVGQSGSSSYLMSPRCGVPEFKSLGEIASPGDFCIEAMVTEAAR
ncbi:hypothetical protein IV203_032017 [Nitzschia inconspicua]|uniref:Uncharacterized protein n=1 Tax=Nitzschia inconspicua TaxID=303405 RepID=A0A9K3LVE8_9STRA|nr:hypothetical protein IV203_032017 [Nitzschia inconspicua]